MLEKTAANAKAIATKIVEEKFPGAQAAFCAGSIVRDEGTTTSDIDLVVVFPQLKQAWRESFMYEGWPVEAFVHDAETLSYFFREVDGKSGIPSLPQMVREGLLVHGEESQARKLRDAAQQVIDAGPASLNADEIRNRIYGITDLLDDLRAPKSREEAVGIGIRLYDALGDFILRSNHHWSGSGKQLLRALSRQAPEAHAEFTRAFEALFSKYETQPIIEFTERVNGPLCAFAEPRSHSRPTFFSLPRKSSAPGDRLSQRTRHQRSGVSH